MQSPYWITSVPHHVPEESREQSIPVCGPDGHRWELLTVIPQQPRARLLWLPALGVAARHYLPFAKTLAASGIAVFVHDWRGNGSSNLRPSRGVDWGYRELLNLDLPATEATIASRCTSVARIVGGHSLGGQLACCRLAVSPQSAHHLWLVASGAPYWRAFPPRTRWWLPLVYRFLPWLAEKRGFLPGHSIGFGGRESRSLIRDWALTGLSGRYAAQGIDADLEAGMAALELDVHAVTMAEDWLAPSAALAFLLSKLHRASKRIQVLDAERLGTDADHFAWMKRPDAVVEVLLGNERTPEESHQARNQSTAEDNPQ